MKDSIESIHGVEALSFRNDTTTDGADGRSNEDKNQISCPSLGLEGQGIEGIRY
jgi:hypothetical protein